MVTIELIGRLGNQMFQYAVCRTVAERNGYKFYIPNNKNSHQQNISEYFNLDMGQIDGVIKNRFLEDHTKQNFDSKIYEISDFTSIWGFYQTEKYFIKNEIDVKNWFVITKDLMTESILLKYPVDKYCYIHFRGTDYKTWDGGKRFLPKKYFEDAISKMKSYNTNLNFLVVTDDEESAYEYFNGFEIISNEMMVDFKLIYFSKYCIIPNSTFSWWAAWLSEKELTIAPNNWLNYNKPEEGFYPIDIKSQKFKYV
jgi:hypothetical protein